MCLFNTPKPKAMMPPPAVTPRVETDTTLPVAKQTDTKTADVSYGSSKKKAGPAAAKKEGAAGLKIPLNIGGESAKTGGLNV